MSRIIVWDMGRNGQGIFAAEDDIELEASARDIVTMLVERQYIYEPSSAEPDISPAMVEVTKATLADWPTAAANRLDAMIDELVKSRERSTKYEDMQARHFAAAQQIASGKFTGSAWALVQERSGGEYEEFYLSDLHVPETDVDA